MKNLFEEPESLSAEKKQPRTFYRTYLLALACINYYPVENRVCCVNGGKRSVFLEYLLNSLVIEIWVFHHRNYPCEKFLVFLSTFISQIIKQIMI